MKKKTIAFVLATMVAIGAVMPIAASAASTWNYGYNKSTMQDYNEYLHNSFRHYVTITKSGTTWYSGVAQPRYWAKLYVDYTGPYRVSYNKFDL